MLDYNDLPMGTKIEIVYGLDIGHVYYTTSKCTNINLCESGYFISDMEGIDTSVSVNELATEPYYKVCK